jgi:23S rRNA (adenine2030-N6)-methyltransferase
MCRPKSAAALSSSTRPFEDAADFTRLVDCSCRGAYRKWPTGIYLLWYPIKERGAPDALARRLRRLGVPNVLRSELTLGPPRIAAAGLFGSGLIVINPPFTLERDLRTFLPAVWRKILSPEAVVRTDWLAPERRAGAAPARRQR